ncbi:MAG: alpha-L-glutamate ligase [Bacteroidota bacterium]
MHADFMPKIYILHENPEWLKPITAGLSRMKVPYEDWDLSEGSIPLNSHPPAGVFYNKMSASSFSRGHLHAKDLTAPILAWLEMHGRRVVNKRRALQLEVSKAEQQIALQKVGLKTPESYITHGKTALLNAAHKFLPQPFILKPNQGGKGLGVGLFSSIEELETQVEIIGLENMTVDGTLIVQEYIKPKNQEVIRMEFIGGKFFYAVKVQTGGGFELCPADACEIDPQNPGQSLPEFQILEDFYIPEISLCESFLLENKIEIAGIEFMENEEGDRFFYDVNTNTNYNSDAESKSSTGKTGIEEVCKFLAGELAKLHPTSIQG